MINKRKVETFTGGKPRKADKILHCLRGYPEGLSPKLIAAKTGLNVNTVKSALKNIPEINKIMRGLYKVENEGDGTSVSGGDLFSYNFHNLVLSAPTFMRDLCKDVVFGLVSTSLCVVNKRATLRLSSDFPLNVSSICFVAGYLSDVVGCDFGEVIVSTVEFNKDFHNLRLDGLNSISVDNLVEQFKLYQKTGGLRLEHKTKVPIGVDSIVDMLANRPDSLELNVKLNEQKAHLKRLTVATERNTQLVLRLADKLGGVDYGKEVFK